MKRYFDTLGLKEGASQEEIESAYTRLSKDLDPKENDNLDFFVEEYNLVQEAYKKLRETDDLSSETEKETFKTNTVPENIKNISEKIPKDYNGINSLNPNEDSQTSNDKLPATVKTNSNKQNNESPNTNASKPKENNIPKNSKWNRGLKIFLTSITLFLLLYSISMFFYSKSKINKANIYYERALVRYEVEDFNRAKEDIEMIDALYEELNLLPFFSIGYEVFEESFILLGDIYINELEYNFAVSRYTKALFLNNENKDTYIKLGDAYVKIGNKNQQAIYNYKKGIKFFKSYDFSKKFKEFYDDKKYILSIAICEIEINKNPRSFYGYFNKAIAYNGIKDDKSAIKQNLIALNINPNSKRALYNHGLYLYNEEKYSDAIEYLSKAIKEDSNYKLAYYMRGKSYDKLSNDALAIRNYDKVIQIDPNNALAYSFRGSSYNYQKNYKKAIDDYNKAKSLDPNVYIRKADFENSNLRYNEEVSRNLKIAKRNNSLIKRTREFNKIKIGDYFMGGIVFGKNHKTLEAEIVATTHSLKKISYNQALKKANNLSLNGFSDWNLPSKQDFINISNNHKIINSKGSKSGKYFTKIKIDRYWIRDLRGIGQYMYVSNLIQSVTSTVWSNNSSSALSIAVKKYKF